MGALVVAVVADTLEAMVALSQVEQARSMRALTPRQ